MLREGILSGLSNVKYHSFINIFFILIIRQMFEELLPHHMIDDLFPEVWRQVNSDEMHVFKRWIINHRI